jgi:hypothetical protein
MIDESSAHHAKIVDLERRRAQALDPAGAGANDRQRASGSKRWSIRSRSSNWTCLRSTARPRSASTNGSFSATGS